MLFTFYESQEYISYKGKNLFEMQGVSFLFLFYFVLPGIKFMLFRKHAFPVSTKLTFHKYSKRKWNLSQKNTFFL